jgi:hypothetical protein
VSLSFLEISAVTFAGLAALAGTVQTALIFWSMPQPFRFGIHERQIDLCLDFIENSERFRFLAYGVLVNYDSLSTPELDNSSKLIDEMTDFANRFVALGGVEVISGGIGSLAAPSFEHDGHAEQVAIADFYYETSGLWLAVHDMDAEELTKLGSSEYFDDALGSIEKLTARCGELVSAKSRWVS